MRGGGGADFGVIWIMNAPLWYVQYVLKFS